MASQVKDAAWLEWISGLMGSGAGEAQPATLPPAQFHCLLQDLPLHLIPPHGRPSFPKQPLFFNPDCSVLSAGQLPEELQPHRHLLKNFNLQCPIAWVRDLGTGCLSPFWLSPQLEATVLKLRAGECLRSAVPTSICSLLAGAGILIPEGYAERRLAKWASIVKQAAHQFQEKGYAPLRNLIHPYNLAALRRYYRRAIRQGEVRLGDEHVPRRYVAHNESVASFFHYQMANTVSSVVSESVKPSYAYLASYLSGAELKKHIDRQQCEFSMTLAVDFSPEPQLATQWPIRLDTLEGTIAIYQALGDGLVYRGTKVPHYRNVLTEGYTSTSIFFHYVPANFAGPLE